MISGGRHSVLYLAKLLLARRREIGTPRGSRALSCWKQAVFTLAWFRDRPDVAPLGRGFGISQATAYRYLAEAISVLTARPFVLSEHRVAPAGMWPGWAGWLLDLERAPGPRLVPDGRH